MPPDYLEYKADYIEPQEGMSDADARELARLVGKYGRAKIARWARTIPLPGKGRRRLSAVVRERMWLAEIIEYRAHEHREAGRRNPKYEAQYEVYQEHFFNLTPGTLGASRSFRPRRRSS
jgi:hypothetical protein